MGVAAWVQWVGWCGVGVSVGVCGEGEAEVVGK